MHRNHQNPRDKYWRDQHHQQETWIATCVHQGHHHRRQRDRQLICHEQYEDIYNFPTTYATWYW